MNFEDQTKVFLELVRELGLICSLPGDTTVITERLDMLAEDLGKVNTGLMEVVHSYYEGVRNA